MGPSTGWFIAMAGLSCLGWAGGIWLARRSDSAGRVTLIGGMMILVAWVMLIRQPSLAVQVLPVDWLARIEGTLAAPLFLLIVGVLFERSEHLRERRLTVMAAAFGVLYLMQGGMWMLQTTPMNALGRDQQGGLVMQSQDYSCVAAASATTLNMLGHPTTEAEMAELTFTRPGTGSTLIRALAGINQKLEGTGVYGTVIQPRDPRLADVPMPAMTTLRVDPTRLHMVTLVEADLGGVVIADPTYGARYVFWEDYWRESAGPVIVFTSTR